MAVEFAIDGDENKSREALIRELGDLRARLAALESRLPPAGQEVQDHLRITLESIGDGFFACDKDWRFVYLNRLAEKLLGIRREEVLGKSHWEVFPRALGTRLEQEYLRVAAGEIRAFENLYEPWGRWFHIRCFPREGGGMSVYLQDITDRKRTEEELGEVLLRQKEAVRAGNVGIWDWDLITNKVRYSSEWKRQIGYKDDEISDDFEEWRSRVHPEDLQPTLDKVRQSIAEKRGNHRVEFRFRHKDGSYRWIYAQASILQDESGRPVKMVGSHIDITERKQTEVALRKSEERFRKIYENAAMGIAIADERGCYRHCNPAFCKLLGYTEEELQQMAFAGLVHPDDREANLAEINRLVAGEVTAFEIKNRYMHKNGLPVWVYKFVSILPGEAGQPGHFLALVSDITPTLQAKAMLDNLNEALLERTNLAEKRAADVQQLAMELSLAEDRERQRLASVLHDDLQQMLAYLKIQLTSPISNEDEGNNIDRIAGLVDRCIDHCRNLSHDLNPPILKKKDFAGALKWLCRRMHERLGLAVDLQMPPDQSIHPFVLSSMLFRSIRELLFNVSKHAGVKSASVVARVENDRFLVTVKDAGVGCDPALLRTKQNEEDVFGLFDIEDRIRFLGGEVRIDSRPGKGFEVTLSIPLEGILPSAGMPAIPEGDAPPEIETLVQDLSVAQALDGAVIKVMIAEDNDLMRAGLSKLLQDQEGMMVVCTAANGREAAQLASRLTPDVILMDVSMPVMDGIKATAAIRKQQPGIRVIGLTIHRDPDIRQAMLDAGACACLSKSGSPDELIRTIRLACLSKPGMLDISA